MKKTVIYIILLCLAFAIAGCNKKQNEATTSYLIKLDSLLDEQPQLVLDSLSLLEGKKHSRFNTAYSALLQTIAQDKTDFVFHSDSMIQKTAETLSDYKKEHPELYARSLLYTGMVRYRMGITDSTAFLPIKEAAQVLENSKLTNSKNAYLCYYYLGILFFENTNAKESIAYFKKSIPVAKYLNHRNYLFNSYRDLAWSYMQNYDYKNT